MSGQPLLRATALTKRYGTLTALDEVELTVEAGEVRALLGPNGAGKTTLLRLLFGLTKPDAGEIELLGRQLGPIDRARLHGIAGFVEEPSFYPYLSGRANLELLAELDGGGAPGRIDGALARTGLSSRAGDRVGGYSTGMRQRLGIAAALLRSPQLLLLDEPTAAIDPEGVRDVLALLAELSRDGVAVLISSHQIDEVEEACDSFTVLRHGRVVWNGGAERLRAEAGEPGWVISTSDDGRALQLATARGIEAHAAAGGALELTAGQRELDGLVIALGQAGVAVRRLVPSASPLRATYDRLTQ